MTGHSGDCQWCHAACVGVDLTVVSGDQLAWFWQQIADAGDRRGDPNLVTGNTTVTAPADPTRRAAALGLLGGRAPGPGQAVRVNLAALAARLQKHDPRLTPGMVAAHAVRRSLAERARSNAQRRDAQDRLRRYTVDAFAGSPESAPIRPDMQTVWPLLQRSGWVARLMAAEDPRQIIDHAVAVVAALPPAGERRDRRRLADQVTRFPHALDGGTLPGLVLAILTAAGAVPIGLPTRAAWATAGVDCDDLTGGLLALGIYPTGWILPAHTVVTIPPRELTRCTWPPPDHPGAPVYVTENPSVVTATAELVEELPEQRYAARILCTVGTPSAREIDAIGRLADTGWQVMVRADFDEAGLQHVAAVLHGVPTARPWRMGAADYLASLSDPTVVDQVRLRGQAPLATPWDPHLQQVMRERGVAAYEEALIDALLEDVTDHQKTAGKINSALPG